MCSCCTVTNLITLQEGSELGITPSLDLLVFFSEGSRCVGNITTTLTHSFDDCRSILMTSSFVTEFNSLLTLSWKASFFFWWTLISMTCDSGSICGRFQKLSVTTKLKCAHPCLELFLRRQFFSTLTQDMVYVSCFPPHVGFQSLNERHHFSFCRMLIEFCWQLRSNAVWGSTVVRWLWVSLSFNCFCTCSCRHSCPHHCCQLLWCWQVRQRSYKRSYSDLLVLRIFFRKMSNKLHWCLLTVLHSVAKTAITMAGLHVTLFRNKLSWSVPRW